jgi:hypothetical protein
MRNFNRMLKCTLFGKYWELTSGTEFVFLNFELSPFKDPFQEYQICMTEIITCITWLNTLYFTLKKNKGTYARSSAQNISGSKSGRLQHKVFNMHLPPAFNRPKLSVHKEHSAPKWAEFHFMLHVFPATHQRCTDQHRKSCTLLY